MGLSLLLCYSTLISTVCSFLPNVVVFIVVIVFVLVVVVFFFRKSHCTLAVNVRLSVQQF